MEMKQEVIMNFLFNKNERVNNERNDFSNSEMALYHFPHD